MDQTVAQYVKKYRLSYASLPSFVQQRPELKELWDSYVRQEQSPLHVLIAFSRECKRQGVNPFIPKKAPNISAILASVARDQALTAMAALKGVLRRTRLQSEFRVTSKHQKKGNPFVLHLLLDPGRQTISQALAKLDGSLYNLTVPFPLRVDERKQYKTTKVMNPTAASVRSQRFDQGSWYALENTASVWIGVRTVKEGILVRVQFPLFNSDLRASESVRQVIQTLR